MSRIKFVVAVVMFLLVNAYASQAEAHLDVHPRFSVSQEYTDNFFLTHNNKEEDWTTAVMPGLVMSYTAPSIDASLDYSLHYRYYQNHSESNEDQFKDIQRATASALFFHGRPFTLNLSETIARETLDERLNSSVNNTLVNKATVYRTNISPQYRWQLVPSFSIVFGYSYDRADFVRSTGDYFEHGGDISLVKELSSNTSLRATSRYAKHQAKQDEDYTQTGGSLGLTQKFGPRLEAQFEGGIAQVNYDLSADENLTTLLGQLDYKLSATLALGLGYAQNFSLSVINGLTREKEARLGLTYQKHDFSASGELSWRRENFLQQVRRDEFYTARGDVTIPLSKAFRLGFDGEVERGTFDSAAPTFKRFIGSAGTHLSYEYRRVLASLGYNYRLNISDINADEYRENLVSLSLTLRL